MNRERFVSIVAAYGAEPRRWPAAERARALAFAETDAEAASALEAARRLDRTLDESRPLAASRALHARILASAPRPQGSGPRSGWWAQGAGLAAAGVAGLVFGASLLAPSDLPQPEAAVFAEIDTYEAMVEPLEGQL